MVVGGLKGPKRRGAHIGSNPSRVSTLAFPHSQSSQLLRLLLGERENCMHVPSSLETTPVTQSLRISEREDSIEPRDFHQVDGIHPW